MAIGARELTDALSRLIMKLSLIVKRDTLLTSLLIELCNLTQTIGALQTRSTRRLDLGAEE